jgi:hypothetical protein
MTLKQDRPQVFAITGKLEGETKAAVWIGGICCLIRGEASGSHRRRPPCVPLLSF